MVVEGSLKEPRLWYIICEKRLVTYKVNAQDDVSIITGLITLIAVYFMHSLEYKKDVWTCSWPSIYNNKDAVGSHL